MKREYIYGYASLSLYFLLIALISTGGALYIVIAMAGITAFLIFMYRVIKEEPIFYLYIFVSLLTVLVPFAYFPKIGVLHIAVMYALLIPLIYHFLVVRFGEYGRIHRLTYLFYFVSPLLSFLSVYLILYLPITTGFYVLIGIVFLALLLYYPLSRLNP